MEGVNDGDVGVWIFALDEIDSLFDFLDSYLSTDFVGWREWWRDVGVDDDVMFGYVYVAMWVEIKCYFYKVGGRHWTGQLLFLHLFYKAKLVDCNEVIASSSGWVSVRVWRIKLSATTFFVVVAQVDKRYSCSDSAQSALLDYMNGLPIQSQMCHDVHVWQKLFVCQQLTFKASRYFLYHWLLQ